MDGTCRALRTKASFIRNTVRVFVCVAVFLVGSGIASTQSNNSRVIVGDVYIQGIRNIPAEKAMNYIHSRPGTEYSHGRAMEDISRLAASKLFKDIRGVNPIQGADGRMNLTFVVVEHANVVRDVIYKHAKHVNVKDLEGMTRVQPGMPLDKTVNRLACYEIEAHLRKQGYYFANVSLEEGHEDNHDRVVFNITEGPRVRVRSVDFIGQKELAYGERLRTQIDTSRALLGTWSGEFNPPMVDNDVIKLEEYYRANGYLGASVSRELRFSDDFLHVDIVFHIREGERFRVYDWTLEGGKEFPREQLTNIITVKKNDFYNENVVAADVNNLTNFHGWRGKQADVRKIITEVPEAPNHVRVQYVIQDQPQAYVGEVIIVGNSVTKDRVIRRVLGIYPGQVLRYPELRVGERDLARLGIFDINPELGIRPTVQALESPGPYKDVLVKVNETRTGSIMLGAGVSSDSGIVGSIVLNERNFDIFRLPTSFADFFDGKAFRGAGQELRIEAVPGNRLQRYSASIREPFLFDRPYSLFVSGYYRDRIFDEYTEGRLGGRVNLSHMFTKEWSAGLGLRAENISVSNIPFGAPIDYTSVYGHSRLVAPSITASLDRRDSALRPTEGGRVEASYEQAFGSYTFPIVNIEGSQYFTVRQRPDGSGKHVIAMRSQFSYAGDNTPVYERFFAGGYTNIRGFEFRGVGPNVNGFMVGGQFQFLNRIEYQIPIRANDQLYFVTFLDSGTVESKLNITDYRVSAGFGLRIAIPMLGPVPLALDFGFPINRIGTDRTQTFSFGVGIYP